jgi:hypothetical protein
VSHHGDPSGSEQGQPDDANETITAVIIDIYNTAERDNFAVEYIVWP